MGINILGTGSSLPKLTIHNDDLATKVDTSHEWIYKRTGIVERRLATDETAVSMGVDACKKALEAADMDAQEIDLIVLSSITSDYITPATSCIIQKELGIENAAAFDISAGCTGFVYALTIAASMLQSMNKKNALVLSSELISRIVDWEDRSTCVLFGDGAGAAVISVSQENAIIHQYLRSDGNDKALMAKATPQSHFWKNKEQYDACLKMDGRAVFEFASFAVLDCLEKIEKSIGVDKIDLIVPHQANKRILKYAAKKMGMSKDKIFMNIEKYANISSASIPVALDLAVRSGAVKKGDIVALVGFGAGYTWGHCVIKWIY